LAYAARFSFAPAEDCQPSARPPTAHPTRDAFSWQVDLIHDQVTPVFGGPDFSSTAKVFFLNTSCMGFFRGGAQRLAHRFF
jgi:hypothetical protein